MESSSPRPRRQACAVPFRIRGGRAEFCLIASTGDSRWSFPRGDVLSSEAQEESAIRQASEQAGLKCCIEQPQPLGQFPASKVDDAEEITAFLLRVELEHDEWSESAGWRRKWCYAEEAKVRIRRKPLRRLVDLAVRHMQDESS